MNSELRDIVFLHGGEQGGWIWDQTIAALKIQDGGESRKIIALDVPGCGARRGSDWRSASHDTVLATLANDLDAAGVNNAVLIGHSQAGTVLPRLSAMRQQRVTQLVYVTACAPQSGQTVSEMMGIAPRGQDADSIGWPLDPKTTAPRDLLTAMFCNDMDEAQTSAFLAQIGEDHWPVACGNAERNWIYPRDVAPSAYVVALRDQILPEAWQLRFAQRIGVSRIDRIDAGHQVMNTRPHALAELVRSF